MKYQLIQRERPRVHRSMHTRINREVRIYEFPAEVISNRRRFLENASKLASLEHPQLPHLTDVQEVADAMHVVIEASPSAHALPPSHDVLEHASRLERISDALAHAHERGVAHGDLSADYLVTNSDSQLLVLGIGIQQLTSDAALATLIQRDHERLHAWGQATLPRAENTTEVWAAKRRELGELHRLLNRLRLGAKEPDGETMRRFHHDLRSWLEEACAAHERQLLCVADPQPSICSAQTWSARKSAIVACLSLAAVGLTAAGLFLGERDERPEISLDYGSKRAGQGSRSDNVQLAESVPFDLSKVGAINSPEATVKSSVFIPPSPTAGPSTEIQVASTGPEPAKDGEEPRDERTAVTETATEPRTTIAAPDLSWGQLPRTIALPNPSDVSTMEIVSDIAADGLKLSLLGGDSAIRQGSFSLLRETADPRWRILLERQTTTSVASIQHVHNSLNFRWAPEAANLSAAKYLCNAVLRLTDGEQTARIAMRQASTVSALPAAVGKGVSRHKLPLDLSPSYADIFVEFLAPPDGLTVPMNTSVMPAEGGELWLGLEARRKSLFLIQVKSRLRRRQALEFVPHSRSQLGEKPRPLKPAAIRKLHQELQLTKQSVLAGKASLRGMKRGKRKVAAKAQLRKLEAHAKKLAEFAEAFAAANDVELRFRVFLRLDDMDVDLVNFGKETNGT